MTTINTYLMFDGNCEEAFRFYQSVFGGEIPSMGRFRDMPPQEGQPPLPDEYGNRVMHVSLPISKETTLMGSDIGPNWPPNFQQGNNFSISISTDSKEEADRLFAGLSEGGKVSMAMQNTFWGDYFGSLEDQFGIHWMVGYNAGSQAE